MAKKTSVTKSAKTQEVATPVEETPVEETPVEEPQVENEEPKQENLITQLLDKFDEIYKTNKMAAEYHKKVNSDLLDLRKQVKAVERKFNKLTDKSTTKRKVNNNARKYIIQNKKFQQLIEKNHTELKNSKTGDVIIAEPEYNSDGEMLITRTVCLQILNSYISLKGLKNEENRKHINMDATLYSIFPNKGKKNGKTIESDLQFSDLMSLITDLLKST